MASSVPSGRQSIVPQSQGQGDRRRHGPSGNRTLLRETNDGKSNDEEGLAFVAGAP
jgi:hypothetical protein